MKHLLTFSNHWEIRHANRLEYSTYIYQTWRYGYAQADKRACNHNRRTDAARSIEWTSVYVLQQKQAFAESAVLGSKRLLYVAGHSASLHCSPKQPGQKRLEKHRFPWPRTEEEAQEISGEQLTMLLSGIDFFSAHTTLTFSEVS